MSIANKTRPVHRVSYETFIGPIPDGLQVLHRCDNPPCYNPAHLFLGTVADNVADMVRKGRANLAGLGHGRSPVSDAIAEQIARRYEESGLSFKAVGLEFGISESCAHSIYWRLKKSA